MLLRRIQSSRRESARRDSPMIQASYEQVEAPPGFDRQLLPSNRRNHDRGHTFEES
jgi:hypothetical protein